MTNGYRNAKLPNHCGDCDWLNWEEDRCYCTNPTFIDDNDIATWLADCDGTEDSLDQCGNTAIIVREENADWQPYNCVCDLHLKKNKDPKVVTELLRTKNSTYARYSGRVRDVWRKHGTELTGIVTG